MDFLKHDSIVIGEMSFDIVELPMAAIDEIQSGQYTELQIAAIVIRYGCESLPADFDAGKQMPTDLAVELAKAIFDLSGMSPEAEAKKPSGTVQPIDSSTG